MQRREEIDVELLVVRVARGAVEDRKELTSHRAVDLDHRLWRRAEREETGRVLVDGRDTTRFEQMLAHIAFDHLSYRESTGVLALSNDPFSIALCLNQ